MNKIDKLKINALWDKLKSKNKVTKKNENEDTLKITNSKVKIIIRNI